MISRTIEQRFWSKVSPEPNTGCWLWTGKQNGRGYGLLYVAWDGRRNLDEYAHRLSFQIAKGPIPRELVIDHLCVNPTCVNPDHMELVTRAENQHRIRTRMIHCRARGHVLAEVGTIKNGPQRTCAECKRISRRASYRRCEAG